MPSLPRIRLVTPVEVANAIGVSVTTLFEIVANVDSHYWPTRVSVAANGKRRDLDVPKPHLARILKKLHRFLQTERLHSDAAHGGICNRSSFSAASKHLGKSAVATRDVSNCYPSISPDSLRRNLLKLGFRSDTARLLAGLMTCRGRVPQGACTSGDALNLFLWEMDDSMMALCEPFGAYTRMADDHTISGHADAVAKATSKLEEHLESQGLSVNQKKKHEQNSKNGMTIAPQRQNVHSIGVNHATKTRIPRDRHKEYVKFAELFIRSARAVSHQSLEHVAAMRRKLMGYINYSRQADISPAKHLSRLLACGDQFVVDRLKKNGVTRSRRKWWVVDRATDRPKELAKIWKHKWEATRAPISSEKPLPSANPVDRRVMAP